MGKQSCLYLGNLDALRDWGHGASGVRIFTLEMHIDRGLVARDYIEGMWLILQQESPEDFVLATGETHSVREFVEKAFAHVDVKLR